MNPGPPRTEAAERRRDAEILDVGRQLASRRPTVAGLRRLPHERGMAMMAKDPQLQTALFKVVDVAPACIDAADLSRHLVAYLGEQGHRAVLADRFGKFAGRPVLASASGRAAEAAIGQIAQRFIVGATIQAALPELGRLWGRGIANSVDLLGESTVTLEEGEGYATRCEDALIRLSRAAGMWKPVAQLEADSAGPIARANLSVKVTGLTPLVRPSAPERGRVDAGLHLRRLLTRARQIDAHLHVDMESLDSREMILETLLGLLAEPEFRHGPSCGLVVQAYLRDSEEVLDRILDWEGSTSRRPPLTVRLVKGAYWDHEMVDAAQKGWDPPVWQTKADADRCFERLTRRLIEAYPRLRPAIASHNLRSVAHAIVYAREAGLGRGDFEIQVLRGLGDGLQDALAEMGVRTRTYSPVGDLVSGMAYLVRRLLENTANDSFLANQAAGADLEQLLARP